GFEQALVVALVEADRGLVEHVEHAGEAGADLAGEPDALALAARQRAGIAGERQVIEAHIVEEAQPLADLLEDALADLVLLFAQLGRQRLDPLGGSADRLFRYLPDMEAIDLHRQRLGLEAIAGAGDAGRLRHVALDFLAHAGALGLLVAALEIA